MSGTIYIGKTKNGAKIEVCKECGYSHVPHFNYECKAEQSRGISCPICILEPKTVDHYSVLDLDQRTDLEIFLSKKSRKYGITYWEVIKKVWNENNKIQLPKHFHKPYYINMIEEIDYYSVTASNDVENILQGATIYCESDVELEPHFHYKLADGTTVAISFKEAEYLYPIPRMLTTEEIDRLIKYLKSEPREDYFRGAFKGEINWNVAIFAWNNQNYSETKWREFPKHNKLDENIKMPNYRKLNQNWINQTRMMKGNIKYE